MSKPSCVIVSVLTISSPPAIWEKVTEPVLGFVVSFLVTEIVTVASLVPEAVLIEIQASLDTAVQLTFADTLTS